MIRRFIPKREDIDDYSEKEIERIQDWINNILEERLVVVGKYGKIRENIA